MFNKTKLSVAISATSLLLVPGLLSAQMLEEVVVTAQKKEQALSDVSLTVTAYNGDQLRALNVRDPRELQGLITNVDIKSTNGDQNPAVTIRGVGLNNFNANNNPTVGMYIDEVFLASPASMSLQMLDIERIEVLKGPQGTLYGRNANGGAVNIYSAKPTQELDGFVSVTAGNYSTGRVEAAVGGGLTEAMSGRVSILYNDQGDNFHENVDAGPDLKGWTNKAARGQLQWDTDRLTANLNVTYGEREGGNQVYSFVEGLQNGTDLNGYSKADNLDEFEHNGPAGFANKLDPSDIRNDHEVTAGVFTLGYEFDAFTFTSITGYISQDRTYVENAWGSPFQYFTAQHIEDIEQFSQEFRFAGGSDLVDWIAGAFYSNDSFESQNEGRSRDGIGLILGPNDLGFFSDAELDADPSLSAVFWQNDQKTESYAAYVSLDWHLSTNWTLVTGLRYTDETTSFEGGTQSLVVEEPEGFTAIDDEISDNPTTWRLALEWRPTDNMLAYASASTGFKSGGYNGDFSFTNAAMLPYDPEEITAYEIGAKATMAEGKVQLDGSLFFYDYQDIQTTVQENVGDLIIQRLGNMESADISGAELELTWMPLLGLDFRFGAGYLNTEISDPDPMFDGNELPNSPQFQGVALGRYELGVSDGLSLAFQLDAKYTDEMFKEASNSPLLATDSYTVVNGSISLLSNNGNWELAAWGKNLADERYQGETIADADFFGIKAAGYGAPRTYGLTFTYNLGI